MRKRLFLGSCCIVGAAGLLHAEPANLVGHRRPTDVRSATPGDRAAHLAAEVTIHRDGYGVPHVFGGSDESVVFGFAYAQAEDFFWQIEDSYILSLGRYCEVYGPRVINSDLLNRAYNIVPTSRRDFQKLDATTQSLCTAYVDGLNFYLAKHPECHVRLIGHFEPWHVLAFYRHIQLELCYRYTHLSDSFMPRNNRRIWAQTGSNGWAISGTRTKSGGTMLLVNPHQPFYGFGQLYEAHLHGQDGTGGKPWSFTGATFLGSPLLTIGHNARLGWTMTTNEPDIADAWELRFTNPTDPLAYEYDGGYREATIRHESIRVITGRGLRTQQYKMLDTHHGPIVEKIDDTTFLAARISGLYDIVPMRQVLPMMKSQTFAEFKTAIALLQIPFMNILYADADGNTFYVYGARAPRRDKRFDWTRPVDGSDPATEWLGVHGLDDLPQVLNPPSGFLQNCNSSPFITTDAGNPSPEASPPYLVEDAKEHKRRALRSLEMLRVMNNLTLDDMQAAAFDTEVYWARHEMPALLDEWKTLEESDAALNSEIESLVAHLRDWDCRVTADSTAATLCEAWYEEMYEHEYPGEKFKQRYANDPALRLKALALVAAQLERLHGTWKVPFARIHRHQRRANTADLIALRFNDKSASLPCLGTYGPMGVIFTQYYTPSLHIPLIISQKKRYGVVGAAYLAVYEFLPDGVRGRSVVPYGASGDPKSPHFTDQAELYSATRLKPMPFTRDEVLEAAVRSYRPGEEVPSPPTEQKPMAVRIETGQSAGE